MDCKYIVSGVGFSSDISAYDIADEIRRLGIRFYCRFHRHVGGIFHVHFVVEIPSYCSLPGFVALIGCRPDQLSYVSSFDDCKGEIIEHIRKERMFYEQTCWLQKR